MTYSNVHSLEDDSSLIPFLIRFDEQLNEGTKAFLGYLDTFSCFRTTKYCLLVVVIWPMTSFILPICEHYPCPFSSYCVSRRKRYRVSNTSHFVKCKNTFRLVKMLSLVFRRFKTCKKRNGSILRSFCDRLLAKHVTKQPKITV